ncbi:hypothetical protein C343_04085 [Cryptococcus neoformans C23]|uniref:Pericentrin/AKAP-450 centrosomal targeting domain-containing protein n=1 Tax=Cryptococcus neoformans (strain H99 / ATCC 208821 / CBS 10515 / FGSC 9487) TaxID=235443 RepID=J9VTQ6_CRYN9|nr:hypothetical protein CNAG_06687 [Cryptococcus neoformans var. grubii H99]AUB25836.1 hypothetical protein CKF44_06687 [Cryptococcus neoformans var. grubii]OWZ30811.1 hypothetical protein C347_04146 [Cryptococcus neoformans var. grubii AD2-60a]OWZ43043.1 hypothetical protein C343_04085 [Cryptococcus neoformans var. grubii C23]OXC83879.1 hypothetical protein C344_03842 [Cryptococcus neoformans var. grubii AD1-7a]AFR95974.1 hypothetical protein CNAG_06687 [Cryptococcus neoformans var. grubii H9|eukprot:XP_012050778.1 hypothetical protein CNAG_06687 [Cryptococcus neoformans var. grubii H99]
MAAAYPLDTPSRVLKRVQQMEDMELPSLPSFHHDDLDYDSMSAAETSREYGQDTHSEHQSEQEDQQDMTTPHPLRQAVVPSSIITAKSNRSPADSFSTASGSPFPPLIDGYREETSSPYEPTTALTSTPLSRPSHSQSRSLLDSTASNTITTTQMTRHERTSSGAESIASSTATKRDPWQMPGEMSRSFSGDEIPPSDGLGSERSVPLNDTSEYDHSQEVPELPSLIAPEETPTTRRLSSSNIQFERPRRRAFSATPFEAIEEAQTESSTPSTPQHLEAPAQIDETQPVQQERIPSLSRSEVTGTDHSVTSTPEGPIRNVSMMTPRADAPGEYELTEEHYYNPESQSEGENPTLDYNQEYEYTPQQESAFNPSDDYDTPSKPFSPAKHAFTPSDDVSTPGTIRAMPAVSSLSSTTSAPMVLQDVTDTRQNTPFTPSPNGTPKVSDFETPRAPLDDAERRKSHVLAVLNSAAPPSRTLRRSVRGTPHPLRRVSTAPASDSIAEENSGIQGHESTPTTNGMLSRLTDASGNESFVSVASSADLTTDGRASRYQRLSRGNISFPLLPVNPSTSSGSLKGFTDRGGPNVKIHKHLNEMNKQLLETNAELAREAEAWRDEVERLQDILHQAGVDANEYASQSGARSNRSGSQSHSHQLPTPPRHSPSRTLGSRDHSEIISQLSMRNGRSGSPSKNAQDLLDGLSPEERAAVVQEMAERLESLEEEMNTKEEAIAELQEKLEYAHQSQSPDVQSLHEQIEELARQLEETEQARVDLQSEFSKKTEEHAAKFTEICTGFESQVKTLEKDLASAREEADRLRAERTRLEGLTEKEGFSEREEELRKQVREMQVELEAVKGQAKEMHDEAEELRGRIQSLIKEKEETVKEFEDAERRVKEYQKLHQDSEHRAERAENDLETLGAELKEASSAQLAVEEKLAQYEKELEQLDQLHEEKEKQLDQQQNEIQELNRLVQQLEAAQEKVAGSEWVKEELERVQKELEDVQKLLEDKEIQIGDLRGKLEVAEASKNVGSSRRRSSSGTPAASDRGEDGDAAQNSFVIALEDRLDEAYREIGRLKREIDTTPHRKSAIEVRDARIRALEREKVALSDRLAQQRSPSVTSMSGSGRSAMIDAGSPFKRPTPFVHKTIASLRAPKTPGSLHEPSWLQTTIQSANEPLFQAQIEYLQHELKEANEQLDQNFNRLETAGLGAVQLAEKLAAAEERISELEDEVRTLGQRNKASLALVGAQREEQEQEAESRLKKALNEVHRQMDQLKSDIDAERARLQRDNGRLQDLVSEMRLKSNAEVESFKTEMERMAEGSEREVEQAREEVKRVEKERDELKHEIQILKSRVTQLERELSDERRAYDSLSRRNAQIACDGATAAQLRAELSQTSEAIRLLESSLRDAESISHHLRETLARRDQEVRESEAQVNKYRREREIIAQELREFENDLQKHKIESEDFGQQLQALKREQTSKSSRHAAELQALEREMEEVKERERRLRHEVQDVKTRYEKAEKWRELHECDAGLSDTLAEQKSRFKAQSRELATQIRYLKAKYTREATFRNALALQKRYLLLLVGGKSLNEQATIKAIAKMGFPIPEPPRPARTFKAVALAVLSTIRARNDAARWRTEVDLKISAAAARNERRRVSGRA